MFEITHPEGQCSSEDFDIKILENTSNYFRYLINASRLYWRKELEEGTANMTAEEAENYLKEHRFDIAGPILSPEEIQEQKRCLIKQDIYNRLYDAPLQV